MYYMDMSAKALSDEELAEKFGYDTETWDVDRIPDPIMRVMRYINSNTGLLGDYNDGVVTLAEGGRTIQWYPRRRMFSTGDDLLTWLQRPENDDVILGQVGTRQHPKTGETSGYIEIMESDRWIQ